MVSNGSRREPEHNYLKDITVGDSKVELGSQDIATVTIAGDDMTNKITGSVEVGLVRY